MYNPISTYRIQFHKDFTLKDLENQIEYLSLLGVGTIYASPLFAATPGSEHGYDIVNPHILNPEVTNLNEFERVHALLKNHNIAWLQDIVPNHMAFHHHNAWLMDVLEKGKLSIFHPVFDLEYDIPDYNKPLMVPFLGKSLGEAVKDREIQLGWNKGNFAVQYYDNKYPVRFESFQDIISKEITSAPDTILKIWEENNLALNTPNQQFLYAQWENAKHRMQTLYLNDETMQKYVDHILKIYNNDLHLLKEVIAAQYYELCFWQETERRINYRRFFTVNGLICLRMEDPWVFAKYHEFIGELLQKQLIQGLRIDHIDGLNDPNGYLEKLRKLAGDQVYIVTEKILEPEEGLPEFWPVQGSTGYDYLAIVNNLLTSTQNYNKLRRLYREVTNVTATPADLIYQNKKMILTTRMHGEWDNIFNLFNIFEFVDYEKEGLGVEEMKEAIGEFMLACSIYRLYPRKFPLQQPDRDLVIEILDSARSRTPALQRALDMFQSILLSEESHSPDYNDMLKRFFYRLMQFTGPLMAKGVEDTSMYQYNMFIAHNEVGDAINARGISIQEYHQSMQERHSKWPLTMNTTSTHDTKRGEDVRARLNEISVLADEWEENVHAWMQMNQKMKVRLDSGLLEPSLSVEYFIYQTILGTFPFSGEVDETYRKRIDEYLVKAMREAKRKVSWRDPDVEYENTVCEFAQKIMDPDHEFLAHFVPFQKKIAWRGVINSLIQLILKGTAPGVTDIYQGTELWDLSLVDPDNRQPVDYALRYEMLQGLINQNAQDALALTKELYKNAFDGRIKLWLTHILLKERKQNPDLFLLGEYIPLTLAGKLENNVLSYARHYNDQWLIVIVPLNIGELSDAPGCEYFFDIQWEDTHIQLPNSAPTRFVNMLTSENISADDNNISANDIFKHASVGLLKQV